MCAGRWGRKRKSTQGWDTGRASTSNWTHGHTKPAPSAQGTYVAARVRRSAHARALPAAARARAKTGARSSEPRPQSSACTCPRDGGACFVNFPRAGACSRAPRRGPPTHSSLPRSSTNAAAPARVGSPRAMRMRPGSSPTAQSRIPFSSATSSMAGARVANWREGAKLRILKRIAPGRSPPHHPGAIDPSGASYVAWAAAYVVTANKGTCTRRRGAALQ